MLRARRVRARRSAPRSSSSSRLELVQHREIAVDHVVHQRVEHVSRAVAQQLGLALGARAHGGEAALRAMPHRQDVVGADEDVDLADASASSLPSSAFSSSTGCSTANSESPYSSIFGRWWPLRASSTASSCRPNSSRHLVELFVPGLDQRHPDEAVGAAHVLADVLHRDVGELLAVLVGDAVDQHGGCRFLSWRIIAARARAAIRESMCRRVRTRCACAPGSRRGRGRQLQRPVRRQGHGRVTSIPRPRARPALA